MEKKLNEILDLVPDAIIALNEAGYIAFANKEASLLFDVSKEKLISQPFESFFSATSQQKVKIYTQHYLNGQQPSEPIEVWTQTKNTEGVPVQLSLRSSGKGKNIIVAYIRDLSNEKKKEFKFNLAHRDLEDQVGKGIQELKKVNEELESFTYSVSHDLRAPLRAIGGFSQAIQQELQKPTEEIQHYLERIIANTSKMGDLIDDLLSFSRMKRKERHYNTILTRKLILRIIKDNSEYKQEYFHLKDLPNLYCDQSMLTIVFENLISNAIKYSSKNQIPKILIEGDMDDDKSTITIRDNGVGFDPKYKHKLFGVFQRLHTEDEFSGTGIGLALCRKIIHSHHGTIDINGALNMGTSVTFTLPNKKEEPHGKAS